ncbi:MAG: nucleotidyltransferase domain-containing protein [Ignavibacteriaceae bacterium]
MNNIEFENILLRLSNEIKEKYPDFNGTYLYGSRLRGNFNKDSDYDIVLVFDRPVDSTLEKHILSIIYKYEIEYDILFDFSCYSSQDIINTITPFRENIIQGGRFYAAR